MIFGVSALIFLHYKSYIDVNIILHLVRLKMESDKEHIRYCLLFCFHQKKSAADAHRIICK